MSFVGRRDFLKHSAAAALGLTAMSNLRVMGANEQIRVGVIGAGGKGVAHARHAMGLPGVQLVALADPDPGYKMGAFRDELLKRETPVKVDIYTDFRKMLDRKDIDVVIIASCNHWHVLHSIFAVQAGKHVYVEKPLSHDVWEGRQLANLTKKTDRIVYPGHQHRSRNCWPEVIQYIKEEKLGKLKCVRAMCYKRRESIGMSAQTLTPPTTCDYDLWLGPAQEMPLKRKRFHYDWHWVWNTGNGDIGNQGVHQVDIGRWLLGQKSFPERVFSIGGRFGYEDAGQTPNTQIVYYDYKPAPLILEVRGLPAEPSLRGMPHYKGARIGNVVEFEGGYITEDAAYDNGGKRIHKFTGHGAENHLPGFFKTIRENNKSLIPCPVEESHVSSALCHIGNISYQAGQAASPAEIVRKVRKNELGAEAWRRMLEHLVVNEVDLNEVKAALGPTLTFDAATEQFTGKDAEKANPLLKQNYRKHWAIPEIGA